MSAATATAVSHRVATALEAHGLACGPGTGPPAFTGLNLELGGGRTAAVVGPSGAGKTTLLKTLLGLLPPRAGSFSTLGASPPERPPRGSVAYVPQDLGLVGNLSALTNVLLGTLHEGGRVRRLVGAFTKDQDDRAREALDRVGLNGKADRRPIHLSGGERRRVAIARALAQRPGLLMADEILSELDERTKSEILDAVLALGDETGMATLIVDHDISTACEIADVVCCLDRSTRTTVIPRAPDLAERVRGVLENGH